MTSRLGCTIFPASSRLAVARAALSGRAEAAGYRPFRANSIARGIPRSCRRTRGASYRRPDLADRARTLAAHHYHRPSDEPGLVRAFERADSKRGNDRRVSRSRRSAHGSSADFAKEESRWSIRPWPSTSQSRCFWVRGETQGPPASENGRPVTPWELTYRSHPAPPWFLSLTPRRHPAEYAPVPARAQPGGLLTPPAALATVNGLWRRCLWLCASR